MRENAHLQVFDLRLEVRTPVFVGSGARYAKYEYLFDWKSGKVSVLDKEALFRVLIERNQIDSYENMILHQGSLSELLYQNCQLTREEIRGLTSYTLDAADALVAGKPLREIQAFQRDAYGRAYVPGSSVKGALRTAYLADCILRENVTQREKAFSEADYIHLLDCMPRQRGNAVNSLWRGVLVSDSEPLPDDAMILAGKYDRSVQGRYNQINVCRECVRPGQTIRLKLTLNQAILQGRITKDTLLGAISVFSKYYQNNFLPMFFAEDDTLYDDALLLGGGVGFLSKTVVYPYEGKTRALADTASLMRRKFPHGNHEVDERLGISPHMLKFTRYQQTEDPFGVCGVSIT